MDSEAAAHIQLMKVNEERQHPSVFYSDNQSSHDDGMDWGERWRHEQETQIEGHDKLSQMDQMLLQEQVGELSVVNDYAAALAAVDEAEQAGNDFVAACFYEQFDEESTGVADVPPVDVVGIWVLAASRR